MLEIGQISQLNTSVFGLIDYPLVCHLPREGNETGDAWCFSYKIVVVGGVWLMARECVVHCGSASGPLTENFSHSVTVHMVYI